MPGSSVPAKPKGCQTNPKQAKKISRSSFSLASEINMEWIPRFSHGCMLMLLRATEPSQLKYRHHAIATFMKSILSHCCWWPWKTKAFELLTSTSPVRSIKTKTVEYQFDISSHFRLLAICLLHSCKPSESPKSCCPKMNHNDCNEQKRKKFSRAPIMSQNASAKKDFLFASSDSAGIREILASKMCLIMFSNHDPWYLLCFLTLKIQVILLINVNHMTRL